MSSVQLKNIRKTYGNYVALKDIDVEIASGAFFTLLGPSGCGKTTLLRAIAGFHQQDSGDIRVDGESIGHLGANQRNVGMVFQDYAVFPHLSVFDNVAFGLVQQKLPRSEIAQRVRDILATVQLGPLADRMPHQLSGGQQQRVGLARALAIRPRLLLLDEPLSNLDAKLRIDLRSDIRQLQQSFGITTIYVTHDQEEALAISDQVCVMHEGVVQQVGSPWAVYNRPANRFVASFVGSNNFLKPAPASHGQAQLLGRPFDLPPALQPFGGTGWVASVRPERVSVNTSADEAGLRVDGTIRQAMFTGRELQLTVEIPGHGDMLALVTPNEAMMALAKGDAVTLTLRMQDLGFFADRDNGERIQ